MAEPGSALPLGALIGAARAACRIAVLDSNCRVYEPCLRCELHCAAEHLGKMYGVLAKRRGKVVDEDVVEGTELFVVTATLPAVSTRPTETRVDKGRDFIF